jgi:fatty-acyl-CoA synthase
MQIALTVADFLNRGALVYGARVAVVDEPDVPGSLGSISYTELEARARGMARHFDDIGVAQGERVAIVSPNSARFLISYFGVSGYGRVLVPINFRLSAAEIGYIIEHSGASVLLWSGMAQRTTPVRSTTPRERRPGPKASSSRTATAGSTR